jgi:hypothetical protein
MAKRNRYSKNTVGVNAQGFFTNATAYAGDATLAAFQASGSEGEIIVLAADNTRQTAALNAGEKFKIGQIVDGEVKLSTEMTWGSAVDFTKTAYDAPVIQEFCIGYNGTSGSLGISIATGLQEFVASARDTTPSNQPFPVQEGRYVKKSGTPTEYAIAAGIVNDMNATLDSFGYSAEPFVYADIITKHAGTTLAAGANTTFTLVQGSTFVATGVNVTGVANMVVGNYLSFNNGITSGRSLYKIVAESASGITLDRPWVADSVTLTHQSGVTNVVYAHTELNITGSELGIRLRGVTEDTNFTPGATEDLERATITNTVNWKQGSGAAWQVAEIEKETNVFAGGTVENIAFKEDWGLPTKFVDPTGTATYDLFFLNYRGDEKSNAKPKEETIHYGYVIIGVPASGTVAEALNTIFGV